MNLIGLRTAAITASIALHASLFLQTGGATSASESPAQMQSVTRLSFSKPAPVPESIPEEPQPEPEIKPEPKPEPKKALKKAKAVPKEKKPEPKPEMVAAMPAAAPAKEAPQLDDGVIRNKTKAYLATVIAHIERHKWYPKAARRRGIQGHVEVAFMLFPDGSARIIELNNGPDILLRAVRKTLERATPLPAPPPDIHCPLKCSFRMQFSLDAG